MFDPKDISSVNFFPIAGKVVDVPDEVHKDLSTDQGYLPNTLLKHCLIVQARRDSSQYMLFLECSQPGSINHARWLTKASYVLCLYMSQTIASKSLQRLVSFIGNVYGPT